MRTLLLPFAASTTACDPRGNRGWPPLTPCPPPRARHARGAVTTTTTLAVVLTLGCVGTWTGTSVGLVWFQAMLSLFSWFPVCRFCLPSFFKRHCKPRTRLLIPLRRLFCLPFQEHQRAAHCYAVPCPTWCHALFCRWVATSPPPRPLRGPTTYLPTPPGSFPTLPHLHYPTPHAALNAYASYYLTTW